MPDYVPVDHDPFIPPPDNPAAPPEVVQQFVKGAAEGMGDVLSAATAPMRELVEGASQSRPGDPQSLDAMIGPAAETAMTLGTGGMAAAEKGAAGIFGGKLAKTADLKKLQKAQQMAANGESRDNIWALTGWFQGADNKWRFEIPDKNLKVRASAEGGRTIEHPELEAAYPDAFKTINSNVKIDPSQRLRGSYTQSTMTTGPQLDVFAPDLQTGRSATAHELQHFVQEHENFTFGTSPDEVAPYARKVINKMGLPKEKEREVAHKTYERHAGETEARNVQKRLDMPTMERYFNPPYSTEDVPREKQIVRYIPVEHDPFGSSP